MGGCCDTNKLSTSSMSISTRTASSTKKVSERPANMKRRAGAAATDSYCDMHRGTHVHYTQRDQAQAHTSFP